MIKGTAQLSLDQIFLICQLLKLKSEEQEYLELLLEFDRTGVAERKKTLLEKIRSISEKHMDTGAHLRAKKIEVTTKDADGSNSLADYYLDPLIQIVHVAISIDFFSKNPAALIQELGIHSSQLYSAIAALERMGLAYRENSRLLPREPSLHLSKSSSLFRAWRNQLKLLSMQRINQLPDKEIYSFSTVFSATPETRKIITEKFVEFLKSCESSVANAQAKQVYYMSFDLFSWTTEK